jgi:hypothetical protein
VSNISLPVAVYNVSNISLPVAVVQVGENLTDIDVYVASRVVAVNQPVSLSIEVDVNFHFINPSLTCIYLLA